MKIKELIAEAKKNNTGRKTKNNELYYNILKTLCEDDEYMYEYVSGVENGKALVSKHSLSAEFKQIVANAIRKATSCSEAEASNLAENFKLSKKEAKTLANIVHEADYIAMSCGKKVQLFNKEDLNVSTSIEERPESTHIHPNNNSMATIIAKRNVLKPQHKIYADKKTVKKIK